MCKKGDIAGIRDLLERRQLFINDEFDFDECQDFEYEYGGTRRENLFSVCFVCIHTALSY